MTDLDAIRARDAAWEERFATTPDCIDAYADRRTLLAEVDRLTADYADILVERIQVSVAAERIERARLAALVRGLPVNLDITWADDDPIQAFVLRDLVLQLLEGGNG